MEAFDFLAAHPAPTAVIVDGLWRAINPALERLLGRRDLIGAPAIAVVAAGDREVLAELYRDRAGTHTTRWLRGDGSSVVVEVASTAIAIDGVPALVASANDLTTRELLLGRLGHSEASVRALVDGAPDAMFVHADAAHDLEILWANDAHVRLLGYDDPSQLIGRCTVDAFVHPDDRALVVDHNRRAPAEGAASRCHVRWRCRDGAIRHVEVTRRRIVFADIPAMLVAARDRTDELARERERAAAEAAIRESEERYRLLFDGSPLPIWVFDSTTLRFLAVNDKMVELYGYTRDELLAMTIADIKPPEDVPKLIAAVASARIGGHKHVGVRRHHRKDGTPLDVDVTSHTIAVGGRRCSLAIGVDVTEARRLEEQLRQSQKLDAIGRLAGGIAHDFNNLLSVILTTVDYVRAELGDDHRLAADVDDVRAAADRGAQLTRQLLAFARKQTHARAPTSLNDVVAGIDKLARRLVGGDIAIATRLAPDLDTIHADAGQLEQVVMNLVVNARDAMPDGGRLALETANVELDGCAAERFGVAPGRYVELAVRDTGCGMDDTTRARIFEPFFTTKPIGKGTGLGLATVFGLVKQHDGAIAVDSSPGRGSTFRVYLPRVDGVAPPAIGIVK